MRVGQFYRDGIEDENLGNWGNWGELNWNSTPRVPPSSYELFSEEMDSPYGTTPRMKLLSS
jgi:hypothetical protein